MDRVSPVPRGHAVRGVRGSLRSTELNAVALSDARREVFFERVATVVL